MQKSSVAKIALTATQDPSLFSDSTFITLWDRLAEDLPSRPPSIQRKILTRIFTDHLDDYQLTQIADITTAEVIRQAKTRSKQPGRGRGRPTRDSRRPKPVRKEGPSEEDTPVERPNHTRRRFTKSTQSDPVGEDVPADPPAQTKSSPVVETKNLTQHESSSENDPTEESDSELSAVMSSITGELKRIITRDNSEEDHTSVGK